MEALILRGKVQVNGSVIKDLGTKVDPDRDKIFVNGKFVRPASKGVILLNKPRGVVSTLDDPEGRPTVADYLTKHYQSYFPVGRLDWDSTGLIILTNDGEFAERLMHPRYGVERVYHARVEGSVSGATLGKMALGVKLPDGIVQSIAKIISNDGKTTWLEVRVREGRNRVVRRMCERVGHPVMKLRRVSYGPFRIGKLVPGQIRVLTQKEYENARKKIMGDVQVVSRSKQKPKTKIAIKKSLLNDDEKVIPFSRLKRSKKRKQKKPSRWGR